MQFHILANYDHATPLIKSEMWENVKNWKKNSVKQKKLIHD